MTHDDFAERMQAVVDECGKDPERAHSDLDDVMEEVLRDMGFDRGMDIFDKQTKWYN